MLDEGDGQVYFECLAGRSVRRLHHILRARRFPPGIHRSPFHGQTHCVEVACYTVLQRSIKVKDPLSGIWSRKPAEGTPGSPFCTSADHCIWPPLTSPISARLKVKWSSLASASVTTRLLNDPVALPL